MGTATAGADLDALMASFNSRIKEIGNLMLMRSGGSRVGELKDIDAALSTAEHHFRVIKDFVKRESESMAKAQVLAEMYSKQTAKLQLICSNLPARLPGNDVHVESAGPSSMSNPQKTNASTAVPVKTAAPREKKGKEPPPRWYVSMDELTSLSSYMRGRLTLDKLNTAVDEMATFATGNAKLLSAPRQKLGEKGWNRVLELRDIAVAENVKGKHFFLESDLKGEILKLDHTGKAVLTVLRHLGRINEVRCGRNRVFVLSRN
ncbi:hypothetical protein KC19_5G138900 [Ceratodon purpureus]|uniref:SKA complex subunit 1 homolog n=1 Tax=Ceratodon purpureus TaxID=3225 RepID=A0A8T0I183_CERPU|nr:hypothetical protein KC19_5G138900 [Ceratodon purpureus]